MIDASTLRELLDYDPETGTLSWRLRARHHFSRVNQWKNWNARYPGTAAGRVDGKGYRAVAVLDHLYRASHLIWLHQRGVWPTGVIDHINGHRDDNRLANLRDVTNVQNARNLARRGFSGTGRLGVTRYDFHGRPRFVARIRVDGRLHHLGYFDTVEEAAAVREQAERDFGFTTHTGVTPKSKRPLKSRPFEPSRGFGR